LDSTEWAAYDSVILSTLIIILGASIIGAFLSHFASWLVLKDRLGIRGILNHSWVYDLTCGVTSVYVLTRTDDPKFGLVYKGTLGTFALAANGGFTYITIRYCERGMVGLHGNSDSTTVWHRIGESHGEDKMARIASDKGSAFVIEGARIANVVFEALPIEWDRSDRSIVEVEELKIESRTDTLDPV